MTIEVGLRVTASTDQAVKALGDVKRAYTDLGATAVPAAANDSLSAIEKSARAAQPALTNMGTVGAFSAKQISQEMRYLPKQFDDAFRSISAGQPVLSVLFQQGSQLRDMFGGFVPALKAVGSMFTLTKVAIGGVIAVVGGLAYAAHEGAAESDELRKSIALTGNAADTSAGQIDASARRIAEAQKVSIGSVRAALAELVATGSFTGATLDSAAAAATALSKLTGKSTADTVKDFTDMGNGVSAWAAKSNLAYNYLTVEQFKYIRNLEAQGRTQEAMRATLEALTETMNARQAPALGTLERLWSGLGKAVTGVWDALKGIGREGTAEDKINSLTEKLKRLKTLDALSNRGLPAEQQRTSAETTQTEQDIENAKRELARKVQRDSDNSAATKQAQQDILDAQKAHQDALAQVDAAGAQKLLQQRLAALDEQQSAEDLANAQGLRSALAHNLALDKIDQQRLAAQAATLQRQIEIERSKASSATKPDEVLANKAAVTALEAQLVDMNARIATAAAKARTDAAAAQTEEIRDDAQKFVKVWTDAVQVVRDYAQKNAASRALGLTDPDARARAEADAKTAVDRQKLAELQRAQEQAASTVGRFDNAAQAANLARSIAEVQQTIAEQDRLARFASYQATLAELQARLQLEEEKIALTVEQGAATTEDAEQRKFAARAAALPQLDEMLAKMRELATLPAERTATDSAALAVDKTRLAVTELNKTARSAAQDGLAQMFTDIETGAKSGKTALLDMVSGFAKAMLNVLNQRLAEQLVSQFANAAGSSSGGFWASLGSLFGGSASGGGAGGGSTWAGGDTFATVAHSGGLIGGGGGTPRVLSSALFAAAPRYHSGGIAGLAPNEHPTILMAGEEVLTANDPRHAKNYQGAGGGNVVNVSVSGAQGNASQQQGAGTDLGQQVLAVVQQWAAKESRGGGILAASARAR